MGTSAEREMTNAARDVLVGRRVVGVRYMLPSEATELGWVNRPVVLEFDNGTIAYVACDEVGNDARVLVVQRRPATSASGVSHFNAETPSGRRSAVVRRA